MLTAVVTHSKKVVHGGTSGGDREVKLYICTTILLLHVGAWQGLLVGDQKPLVLNMCTGMSILCILSVTYLCHCYSNKREHQLPIILN